MALSAIQVQALHKSYGRHEALSGIDFEVNEGEIVGFLGPNGAGKSTAMDLLARFHDPTDGQVLIDGHDLRDQIYARVTHERAMAEAEAAEEIGDFLEKRKLEYAKLCKT